MSVYADERKLAAEREQLSETFDDLLSTICALTEHIDPCGHNITRAKQLCTELQGVLDKLQANDHRLWWTRTKVALIDRCIESDRLQ